MNIAATKQAFNIDSELSDDLAGSSLQTQRITSLTLMKQLFRKSTMQLLSRRNNLLFPHNNEILVKTNTLSESVSVDAQVLRRYIFFRLVFSPGPAFSIYFVVLAE